MTFQERLASLQKRIEGSMPQRYVDIMHKATRQLKESGIQEKVLKVGDKIPDFELPNQDGILVKASELYQKGPLIITFYRGFWCPYCNTDLANLKKYVPEIEELGGAMIAVSPEKEIHSKKIIETQKLNFDILMDQSNGVAEQFGLKFFIPNELKELYRDVFNIPLNEYHGDEEWSLPMPARFLIDQDGIIRFAESNPDYTIRPEPDDLMAVLKK
ncbi:peroxiredoxin-like family protein [Carboxylicivirga sp. RSCT41]|uniref:peroxiredoxin-like family protein n=1 Tax=Carboxylicivirga agarovorans TaxID=3417570 RepID=UPI003D3545B5